MTDYEGSDWGFNAAGTPLGGESALSMPGPRSIETFGSPKLAAYNQLQEFSQHVQRRYEKVSPLNAGLWDPRGEAALTDQPADYYQGFEEVDASIKNFEAEASRVLNGGMPEFGGARPNTNVNFRLLSNAATGLAPESVELLTAALSQYDPGIVETIAVPHDISQISKVNNELGFVTANGGIPDTWQDQDYRAGYGPSLAEAAATSVLSRKRTMEYVDANGVIQNRYSPGTGPYDAPGHTRPGGVAGAISGTVIRGDGIAVRASGDARVSPSGFGALRGTETSGGSKTGYIFGFVGAAIIGVLGLGMLISGVQE